MELKQAFRTSLVLGAGVGLGSAVFGLYASMSNDNIMAMSSMAFMAGALGMIAGSIATYYLARK